VARFGCGHTLFADVSDDAAEYADGSIGGRGPRQTAQQQHPRNGPVKLQADEFDVITPSRLFLKSAFLEVGFS